jgi:hypothetical protein
MHCISYPCRLNDYIYDDDDDDDDDDDNNDDNTNVLADR